MKPNILIRGGIVIDGTGTSAFKADVEITADRITRRC
jgi:N-acyl-D-aspartate/D-glutamate deacylase